MSDKNKKRRVHLDIVNKTHKGKRYRSVLLRTSYRKDGKVLHDTLGNLSDLPDDLIDVIKSRLASGKPLVGDDGSFKITRSLPHGNVNAVLGVANHVGLDRLISSTPSRQRDLVMAMIADRIISPGSKLSCANGLNPATAQNTLAVQLKLGSNDDRIRSHVFLCMLAYYAEWHMRERLRPVLFEDTDRSLAESSRKSVVSKAVRSDSAKAKDRDRVTADGWPVQSFQDVLKDLSTICQNTVELSSGTEIEVQTEPTAYQSHVQSLLAESPGGLISSGHAAVLSSQNSQIPPTSDALESPYKSRFFNYAARSDFTSSTD